MVDDDPDILILIRHFLAQEDFQVWTFQSPQEALNSIEKVMPDLIITDILMPAMNGLLFIQEVRKKHSKVKVMSITEGGTSEAREIVASIVLSQSLAEGADYAFNKPFSKKSLLEVCHGVISGELNRGIFKKEKS